MSSTSGEGLSMSKAELLPSCSDRLLSPLSSGGAVTAASIIPLFPFDGLVEDRATTAPERLGALEEQSLSLPSESSAAELSSSSGSETVTARFLLAPPRDPGIRAATGRLTPFARRRAVEAGPELALAGPASLRRLRRRPGADSRDGSASLAAAASSSACSFRASTASGELSEKSSSLSSARPRLRLEFIE